MVRRETVPNAHSPGQNPNDSVADPEQNQSDEAISVQLNLDSLFQQNPSHQGYRTLPAQEFSLNAVDGTLMGWGESSWSVGRHYREQ